MAKGTEKQGPKQADIVGYMRISTRHKNQSLTMQKAALHEHGVVRLFADKGISGRVFPRPALTKALNTVADGGALLVWRQDRLGRNPLHMETLLQTFLKRRIRFQALSQPNDIFSPLGRLMYRIIAAFDAYEVEVTAERTAQGMSAKRAEGSVFGRKRKLSDIDLEAALKMLAVGMATKDVAKSFKVSPRTLRRSLKRYQAEMDQES